jgi:hypothetical protein
VLTGPGAFALVAARLVAGIQERLDPPAGRAGLVPGAEIAWDACDCDGQLAVAIGPVYPSVAFPTPATGRDAPGGRSPCDVPLQVATLTVQLARCVPGPDDQGNPPTDEALTQAATDLEHDRWTSWQAVRCVLDGLKRLGDQPGDGIDDWHWTDTTTLGPTGGCAAIEHHLLVALLTDCRDC